MGFDDVAEEQVIQDYVVTNYYYGPILEIALPTFYPEGVSKYKILSDDEFYSPVPFAVAVYKLVTNTTNSFGYKFQGVEIRTEND
jgi:hypothetical protein